MKFASTFNVNGQQVRAVRQEALQGGTVKTNGNVIHVMFKTRAQAEPLPKKKQIGRRMYLIRLPYQIEV